jgi:anthranilate synthase component 1
VSLTSYQDFVASAARYSCVPVVKQVLADLLTPVSVFLKIAELSDYAFLLESNEPNESHGRYSFLGKDPAVVLRQEGTGAVMERHGVETSVDEPFLVVLERAMSRYRADVVPGLPHLLGGAVGYFGFDAASMVARTATTGSIESEGSRDRAGVHAEFMIFDTLLVFDHLKDRILIVANASVNEGDSMEAQYQFACARISFLERELDRTLSRSTTTAPRVTPAARADADARLEEAVSRARLAASGGACLEVTLCETVTTRPPDPFSFYRALRHTAPSTYMYFLRCGPRVICGSSEETVMRVDPPAGGEAEFAFRRLQQLVARVPSASVCGVPAGAARAVIAAAETLSRSAFGGAVGYLDFTGALDFCTASRVMAVDGQNARLQAGVRIDLSADRRAMSGRRDIETLLQTLASSEAVR